jgi:excinuclease ABC subunit C
MRYYYNDAAFLPGLVYLIRNGDGEIIYVGKTINLRERIARHRGRGSPFRDEIASVEMIRTKSPQERVRTEIELIRTHRPRYNIQYNPDHGRPSQDD